MDLRNLQTFVQVAELGSFTRAAERLSFSQPTVSFQIKQLENELGCSLFDRIGHTVTLTDSGREALAYAQKICRMAQEMKQGEEQMPIPSGTVRLAMADSLCASLFCERFAALRERFPQISLEVTTGGTTDLFHRLDHNETDIVCTLDSHIYDPRYTVSDEERVGAHFVCAADDPLADRPSLRIEEILDVPLILTEKGMSYRRLLDEYLARLSLAATPVLEISRADLIEKMVEEDLGVSFLPDYVTEAGVRAGRIARLHVVGVEVELWKQVIYRRDKWLSPAIRAVLAHFSNGKLQTDFKKV